MSVLHVLLLSSAVRICLAGKVVAGSETPEVPAGVVIGSDGHILDHKNDNPSMMRSESGKPEGKHVVGADLVQGAHAHSVHLHKHGQHHHHHRGPPGTAATAAAAGDGDTEAADAADTPTSGIADAGPAGPPGKAPSPIPGPPGIVGLVGNPGLQGDQGAAGVIGFPGGPVPGPAGPVGIPGHQGAEGDSGPVGELGQNGLPGPAWEGAANAETMITFARNLQDKVKAVENVDDDRTESLVKRVERTEKLLGIDGSELEAEEDEDDEINQLLNAGQLLIKQVNNMNSGTAGVVAHQKAEADALAAEVEAARKEAEELEQSFSSMNGCLVAVLLVALASLQNL